MDCINVSVYNTKLSKIISDTNSIKCNIGKEDTFKLAKLLREVQTSVRNLYESTRFICADTQRCPVEQYGSLEAKKFDIAQKKDFWARLTSTLKEIKILSDRFKNSTSSVKDLRKPTSYTEASTFISKVDLSSLEVIFNHYSSVEHNKSLKTISVDDLYSRLKSQNTLSHRNILLSIVTQKVSEVERLRFSVLVSHFISIFCAKYFSVEILPNSTAIKNYVDIFTCKSEGIDMINKPTVRVPFRRTRI